MMEQEIALRVAHVAIGLFLLWALGHYCWRSYRIDAFRQELFEVRDEMLLYAADSGRGFKDPAYQWLRDSVNSMIRFAHRVTFIRLVFSILMLSGPDAVRPYLEWRESLSTLPADVRRRLEMYHAKYQVAVLRHMVSGSVILLTAVFFFGVCFSLWQLVHGTVTGFRRLLEAFARIVPGVEPGIELIELQALRARREDLTRQRLVAAS